MHRGRGDDGLHSSFTPSIHRSHTWSFYNMAICTLPASAPRPLVTLVTLTCNRPAFLNLALQAALEQTYRPIEVIVVDDGSKAAPISESMQKAISVRRVWLRTRKSIGEKRNAGLRAARGEIILHWDDDDMRDPRHVATLACPLLKNWSDFSSLTFSYLAKLGTDSVQFFNYAAPGRQSRAAFGPFLGSLAYTRRLALALGSASTSRRRGTGRGAAAEEAAVEEEWRRKRRWRNSSARAFSGRLIVGGRAFCGARARAASACCPSQAYLSFIPATPLQVCATRGSQRTMPHG